MVVGVGLGKCVCEGLIVLFAKCALAVAVQVQDVAQILLEVPDGGDCELDSKMCGVWVGDWNLEGRFTATGEFTQ
ncbi:MAG: hypothetical protein DME54_14980 [Verrucomicrobia bacterium]|nr:MAG: hypothetical protein DME54_14980 [Verrucomicrobiota bacterium]